MSRSLTYLAGLRKSARSAHPQYRRLTIENLDGIGNRIVSVLRLYVVKVSATLFIIVASALIPATVAGRCDSSKNECFDDAIERAQKAQAKLGGCYSTLEETRMGRISVADPPSHASGKVGTPTNPLRTGVVTRTRHHGAFRKGVPDVTIAGSLTWARGPAANNCNRIDDARPLNALGSLDASADHAPSRQ